MRLKKELNLLSEKERSGEIKIFYYDESSFSLNSNLPRAWIKKGINREVPSKKSENLNVCGLYSKDNQFISYTFTGRIDSEILTGIFNSFVKEVNGSKPSYIVLDNAPTHRSGFFKKNILQWESNYNVKFFFLPTYSPELNLIEILWKRIKHSWLRFMRGDRLD